MFPLEVDRLAEQLVHARMTINEVIQKYPKTMAVFNRFNFDSCCGGAKTIEEEARHVKADLGEVLEALNRAAAGSEPA